ncbi:putative endonuclease 8 2 [Actinoplanes ianthinogenes]|uniref:DNA-(apurinic or apyrimidinic site) lyase n=1 Tax=Actinoplanes ianthinogenes TaxID=122358 RepID=A0ABM7LSV3_9ACTN|nr:DNA-formamidopyrimidine glycosylase family protein [Actinoplanes ianthinogenes]BCJ42358.1 putative endonuclease 8 2 [Actinoplanes ianthinogenes]GGR57767.1 putative endonuclease 8 2 [Actinoplanes ianthinogenes]
MPEGDTVWNTARVVERALTGEVLTGSDFRVPRLATTDLTGWTVAESASRGKHLLLRLTRDGEKPLTLHSHLRMDGAWRTYAPGERWSGRPAHLIRVVLRTARSVAVGYHLHDLTLVPTEQEEQLVGHLGPDLLGADWDPGEATRRIAAHPDVTIADALLDQRNLAGVGNLYKAETLFLRGLWPWTRVADVPDLTATVELAQRLVASNRGRWTQTTTGSLRRGETNYVYGRRAQPCRRCGTPVRKVERDPTRARAEVEDRITYWCPRCQPEPAA